MSKRTRNIIIALVLMGGSIFGMTRDIDSIYHYFGNGVIFGIGLSLLVSSIYRASKQKG